MQRADAATGLKGKDLEAFHSAMMQGLQKFGPIQGVVPIGDVANEMRARWAMVAEDLLGPEKADAYTQAIFEGTTERGMRYLQARQEGKNPEESARAAGIVWDLPDAGFDVSPPTETPGSRSQ